MPFQKVGFDENNLYKIKTVILNTVNDYSNIKFSLSEGVLLRNICNDLHVNCNEKMRLKMIYLFQSNTNFKNEIKLELLRKRSNWRENLKINSLIKINNKESINSAARSSEDCFNFIKATKSNSTLFIKIEKCKIIADNIMSVSYENSHKFCKTNDKLYVYLQRCELNLNQLEIPDFLQQDFPDNIQIEFESVEELDNLTECKTTDVVLVKEHNNNDLVQTTKNSELLIELEIETKLSMDTLNLSDKENEVESNENNETNTLCKNQKTSVDKKLIYDPNVSQIEIPLNEWNDIYVEKSNSLDSSTYTGVISKILMEHTGCLIKIKGYDSNKSQITIRAYCGHKSLDGEIKCKAYKLKNRTNDKNVFDLFSSIDPIYHPFKRYPHISRANRSDLKKKLLFKTVEALSEELFETQDTEFAEKHNTIKTSSTDDVLRKMKSEALQEQDNEKDDFQDLYVESLKQINKPDRFIQRLSANPFYVICYSKMQTNLFKSKIKSLKTEKVILYIDATGGIIRPPNPKSKTIYYYALIFPIKFSDRDPNSPFPLSDFVSASHSHETIGEWLRAVKKNLEREVSRRPLIDGIVTDFSFAQINALVEVFNGVDVVEYLKICYSKMKNEKEKEHFTYIFLCCSHLMKNITNDINKYFPINSKSTKFLKEIISSIFILKTYVDIQNVFSNLIVLLKSKFINSDTELCMLKLTEIIKNHNIETFDDINETVLETDEIIDVIFVDKYNKTIYEQSPFYLDFVNITNSYVFDGDSRDKLNALFCIEFLEMFLKKYITFLPMWGGCFTFGKRKSNSHVENYFATAQRRLKRCSHIGKLPTKCLRVLKELQIRNQYLVHRFASKIPLKSLKSNRKRKIDCDIDEITLEKAEEKVEIWKKRGKTLNLNNNFNLRNVLKITKMPNDEKSLTITKLLSKPQTDTPKRSEIKKPNKNIFQASAFTDESLPCLINGSLQSTAMNYTHTCSFDAFVQCCLLIKNQIETYFCNPKSNLSRILDMLNTDSMNNVLEFRDVCLEEIFGNEITNCECNITRISDFYLKMYPSTVSIYYCASCDSHHEERRPYVTLDVLTYETVGIAQLENCITTPSSKCCSECNNSMFSIFNESQSVIALNTEHLSPKPPYKLKDVPKTIAIEHNMFDLIAAVNYISQTKHYVCCCKSNEEWYVYDDLKCTPFKLNYKDNIVPHILFYKNR